MSLENWKTLKLGDSFCLQAIELKYLLNFSNINFFGLTLGLKDVLNAIFNGNLVSCLNVYRLNIWKD